MQEKSQQRPTLPDSLNVGITFPFYALGADFKSNLYSNLKLLTPIVIGPPP